MISQATNKSDEVLVEASVVVTPEGESVPTD